MKKSIKQLNLNPLSVAKFFYEKLGERGVEQPFLQPITYLAYSEILRKENLVLFKENFQAGPACPVLLSLRNLIKKHGDRLDVFFSSVPNITNQQVSSHLERLVKKYADSFGCEIQYKAQDSLWKKTPENQAIRI